MKCQKCGKNEVSFQYSSNINGCVTQESLCLDCAAKAGYDLGQVFNNDRFFGGFDSMLGGFGGFSPVGFPLFGTLTPFPLALTGVPSAQPQTETCDCCTAQCAPETSDAKVDTEMAKRREINVLQEQMRIAASKDDFEKAIELREKIKEIEAQ